jgi:hypothetical protein
LKGWLIRILSCNQRESGLSSVVTLKPANGGQGKTSARLC